MAIVPTAENFKVLPQGVDTRFSTGIRPVDVTGNAKQVARGLGGLAAFFEQKEDEDVIERANRYLMDLSNLQDGYSKRQGEQALKDVDGSDARENVFSAGRESRSGWTEGLSWSGRRKFERMVGAGERSFSHGVNQHHYRQDDAFQKSNFNSMLGRLGQIAAMNSGENGDRDVFNTTLQQMKDLVFREAKRGGNSDLAAQFAADTNNSAFLYAVISDISKNGNQTEAERLFMERIGDLNAGHIEQLKALLTENRAVADGVSGAEELIKNNGKAVTLTTGGIMAGSNGYFGNPKAPRGLRNNNPGNIDFSPMLAKEGAKQESGGRRFAVFDTPQEGLRALGVQVKRYWNYGDKSVSKIIGRFAPPNENNTKQYIADVSRALGVSPDQPIQMNQQTVQALMNAIIAKENSGKNPYSKEMVAEAASFGSRHTGKFQGGWGAGGHLKDGVTATGTPAKKYTLPAVNWLEMSDEQIKLTLEKAIPDNKAYRDSLFSDLKIRVHDYQQRTAEQERRQDETVKMAIASGWTPNRLKQSGYLKNMSPLKQELFLKQAESNAPYDGPGIDEALSSPDKLARISDADIAMMTKGNPEMRSMLQGVRKDIVFGNGMRYWLGKKAVREYLRINMGIDPSSRKESEKNKLVELNMYMDRQIELFKKENKRYPSDEELYSILSFANENVEQDSMFAAFIPDVPRYSSKARKE